MLIVKLLKNWYKQILIHGKALLLATIFVLLILIGVLILQIQFHKWSEDIIESDTRITQLMSNELISSVEPVIEEIYNTYLKSGWEITYLETGEIDRKLQSITNSIFSETPGLEGGFYLKAFDGFVGYAHPTSPPPKPVYGPPPRSYNIIREQVLASMETNERITRIHKFDPAVFPLTTDPISINGALIGATWVRIHIERKLPESKLPKIYNISAFVALLGFFVALLDSLFYRTRVDNINKNLKQLISGKIKRLPLTKGSFAFISVLVNDMVENLEKENIKRQKLEKELHKQEKMAALGRVIAGVAHEVKTPLAIIKTRIQLWQRNIKNHSNEQNYESLQLVVDEIDRLSNLVKRLLIYSKPVSIVKFPFNINYVIQDALKLVQSRDLDVHIQYDVILDPDIPPFSMDMNSIKEVLINILCNAQESIEKEGTITVISGMQNSTCRIEIRDTGVGIKKENKNLLFDPFYSTKSTGAGLGLPISQQKIQAHNGNITLKENEPSGTICIIELPLINKEQVTANE